MHACAPITGGSPWTRTCWCACGRWRECNSTPGGGGRNEIRLRDKKCDEQFALFAERELHVCSGP